jgi:hypothetical protein
MTNNDDIEQRLRTAFHAAADRIEVSPAPLRHPSASAEPVLVVLDDAARRDRGRHRQRIRLAAAAIVAAIVGAAIALVINPWTNEGRHEIQIPAASSTIAQPCSKPAPKGSPPIVLCNPGDGVTRQTAKIVARGSAAGGHWQLEAYEKSTGLCVALSVDGRRLPANDVRENPFCGDPYRAVNEPISFALSSTGHNGWTWVYGPARKDVNHLSITLSDGQQLKDPIVGIGSGGPVNLFVVAVPPGTTLKGIAPSYRTYRWKEETAEPNEHLAMPAGTNAESGSVQLVQPRGEYILR